MKAVLLALLLQPALSVAQPLVVKSSGGGFTPPEWQRWEVCELHQDKVVIKDHFGVSSGDPVTLTREEKIVLDGSFATLLVEANKAVLNRTDNNLCDAPSTTVTAYLVGAKSTDKGFTLFESGGCGSDRLERDGAAAWALRNMVDRFCPTTHDHSR